VVVVNPWGKIGFENGNTGTIDLAEFQGYEFPKTDRSDKVTIFKSF